MKVAVFDTHKFDRTVLENANRGRHHLHFIEARLSDVTASLANGCEAACLFANDRADARNLGLLKDAGVRMLALRSAGFNHVDIKRAAELGMVVARVPEYSPHAIAEHAVGLLQCLNRKLHRAHNRIHEMNFSLDGLVGFDLYGKTVGVIGTGRIGRVFAQIMRGFGCRVLAYDKVPDSAWAQSFKVEYVSFDSVVSESNIISLHVPLKEDTRHLINESALERMREDVYLINTGRGALIDTQALIHALKTRSIGGACLDVYEEEEGIFFSDYSELGIEDDVLARLITFPNVLITSHQAFLTHEALNSIAETTISNLSHFETGEDLGKFRVL